MLGLIAAGLLKAGDSQAQKQPSRHFTWPKHPQSKAALPLLEEFGTEFDIW